MYLGLGFPFDLFFSDLSSLEPTVGYLNEYGRYADGVISAVSSQKIFNLISFCYVFGARVHSVEAKHAQARY